MKRFEYLAPHSLDEALDLMAEHPEAIPLAGGTDLLVQVKEGRRKVEALLSLKRVPEVHHLMVNGSLVIGSAITLSQIAADPQIQQHYTALSMGAGLIGSVQIRNMATVGGNLCNAAPSADTAPPLLVLGAQALIATEQGERSVPLEEFIVGPGLTALKPGELLKEVVVPHQPEHGGSFYLRHTPRLRMDVAVAGVAASIALGEDGVISSIRIALGAVAPVPLRAAAAEELLTGQLPTDELINQAGKTAAREASPIDDLRASAEYRRHLVEVLTERALRGALGRARSN